MIAPSLVSRRGGRLHARHPRVAIMSMAAVVALSASSPRNAVADIQAACASGVATVILDTTGVDTGCGAGGGDTGPVPVGDSSSSGGGGGEGGGGTGGGGYVTANEMKRLEMAAALAFGLAGITFTALAELATGLAATITGFTAGGSEGFGLYLGWLAFEDPPDPNYTSIVPPPVIRVTGFPAALLHKSGVGLADVYAQRLERWLC